MRLLSLFGLDARLRRLRIAAGESAIAAEDRVRLLQLAWEEEKQRLRSMLVLAIAVIGLTTVAVALLSVAIVVHFWETPQRVTAAWVVAAVWIALWLVAVLALLSTLQKASAAFDPAKQALARDWAWLQGRFGSGPESDHAQRESAPATQEEVLARIERQRQRVATLQSPAPSAAARAAAAPKADEPLSAMALRIAREHPVATGVATAATLAVLGPSRVLRWAAVIVPVLWRIR